MYLNKIDVRSSLTKKEFYAEYLLQNKPVVFTDLIEAWPACSKWSFDWFQKNHGDIQVPLHNNNSHSAGKNYMAAQKVMSLSSYIDLLKSGPNDYRIFLFDLIKNIPELKDDFSSPAIMDGFLKNFAYLFFGGEGSYVYLHYDIDCSSVFLTQFEGAKKIILFDPSQSKFLYQHPFTAKSHINLDKPDYEKYPALKNAVGFEVTIRHGETLFIPPLYWHFITYLGGGFSLSLRANNSFNSKAKGLANIAKHYFVDKGMNKLLGEKWLMYKEKVALKRSIASQNIS